MSRMASNNAIHCDLCNARHLTQLAIEYCSQCEESLCKNCDHHTVSKATRSHQTISVDEYRRLPPFVLQIKQHCEEHGEIYEFHCPVHDTMCCKRCMVIRHNGCKGCKLVADLIKDSSSTTKMEFFEKTLLDIERNINVVIEDKKNNLSELEKQKKTIIEKMQETRAEINRYLDKMEQEFLKQLLDIETKSRNEIQKYITKLEEVRDKTMKHKEDLNLMKKHASNIQIFMGARELQEPICSNETFVKALTENGSLNYSSIELDACEILDHISNQNFGSVYTSSKEPRVHLSWQSERAAQTFYIRPETIDVTKTNIKQIRKIAINEPYISGCAIVQGEYILFTTNDQGLCKKYGIDGKFISKFKLKNSYAFDVVPVDAKTVIITGGGYAHDIHFTHIDTLKTTSTNTGDWSYGATCLNGALILCTYYNGVRKCDISYGSIASITKHVNIRNIESTYIASDASYLYHSNNKTNCITCFDLKGKRIWTYEDGTIMEPRGITVDSKSNIYVACSKSNNVIVITRDGKRSWQLLGPQDGLKNPHAINYDKHTDHLLVSNCVGPAFLYKIS